MPSYYGDIRVDEAEGVQEAVCQIASVVGATLVGVDKSRQDGHDYTSMLRTFYHPGLHVAKNIPSSAPDAPGGDSIWYTTAANALYFMLGAQYPDSTGMTSILRGIADSYCGMVEACGGADADLTMQDFDFATGTKVAGRNEGGEAAAGAAAVLLWAATKFGDDKYLRGAKWAMDYLERSEDNLFYEVLVVLAPYVAARLNARHGTSYDVSKYFDWLMQGSDVRNGWGTVEGNWGGYDVSGLGGSRSDTGGYAFAMNTFASTLTAATAKYDHRYADAVGRWMLSLHNAARFFYADQMPEQKQYYGTRFVEDPAHVIAYEGLMRTGPDGIQARSDVPTRSGSWGLADSATGLGLYGASWVGFLAATVARTNVDGVLRTDLNALDFHAETAWPTHLYYNPGPEPARVELALGSAKRLLYDAVTDTVLADSASGTAVVEVPSGSSRVLVQAPAGATVTRSGTVRLIDGVAVGYDAMPTRDLAHRRSASAGSTAAGSSPANAVDGRTDTAWISGPAAGQTFTVDLGTARRVSQAVLTWGSTYAGRCTVHTSADGTTWEVAAALTGGTGGVQEVDFAPVRARWVRLTLSAPSGSGYRLRSLEVRQADLAAGRPVTASSEQNTVNIAAHLTDGCASTRWESAASDPQWCTVDLGRTTALGTVVVVWEAAAAKAYTIQVSEDDTAWTTVYGTESGAGGTATVGLPAGTTGRYVRVHATERATRYAYSAYAVELYAPATTRSSA